MKEWYSRHLGIAAGEYGWMWQWGKGSDAESGSTTWSTFPADTGYFNPGEQSFMINYRVEDLEALLKVLEKEGVQIVGEMESYEYGKFGWVMDPEGNKIELWEPIDQPLVDFEEAQSSGES